jgi:hypothetical protein
MFRWFAGLLLFCSFAFACAVADDDLVSRCPTPDKVIQSSCKEIAYKDLPDGARTLLHKLKCDYDCGSAVDLNGDGSPEYKFCCKAASHGPCGSVVIGKIGTQWKDLTAKEGVLGFDGACNGFVVLMSQHSGFHDVCLPVECAPGSKTSQNCSPTIWRYQKGRYYATGQPSNPSK